MPLRQGEAPSPSNAAGSVLRRGLSVVPVYSPKDRIGSPATRTLAAQTLADNSRASIQARFVVLKAFDAVVSPCLKLIDLHKFEVTNVQYTQYSTHSTVHLACVYMGLCVRCTTTWPMSSAARKAASSPSTRWSCSRR
jgi:hypothetical protein